MAVKTPINTELWHLAPGYEPAKAHDYYERHKHLKGRRHGPQQQIGNAAQAEGKAAARRRKNSARHQQKIALKNAIDKLEGKLTKLEDLIKKKEATLKKDQAINKHKARKKGTPKSAADKAKTAKKYRQSHHQKIKNQKQHAKSGGGSGHGGKSGKGGKAHDHKLSHMPIADLKALATKVKGQIAVAKKKLAAL